MKPSQRKRNLYWNHFRTSIHQKCFSKPQEKDRLLNLILQMWKVWWFPIYSGIQRGELVWKLSRNTLVLALILEWTAKYKTLYKPLPVTPDWKTNPLTALLLPGKEENSAGSGNVLPKPSQSQSPHLVLILALQGVLFSFSRRKHLSWFRLWPNLNNQGIFSFPSNQILRWFVRAGISQQQQTVLAGLEVHKWNVRGCCHKISTLSYHTGFVFSDCILKDHF